MHTVEDKVTTTYYNVNQSVFRFHLLQFLELGIILKFKVRRGSFGMMVKVKE